MAEGGKTQGMGAIRALFGDREAFLRKFEERRKAHDDTVDAGRQRREAFVAEKDRGLAELERALSDEISTTRAALAEVAPIMREEPGRVPLNRAAYSDRMAALMAKLSLLAYLRFEDEAGRAALERVITQGGLTLLGLFAVEDTEAIVVEAPGFIVVAFRGTTSALDRKTDWRVSLKTTSVEGHKKEVRVHRGFYEAFRLVEQPVHELLANASPHKPIFLTGHSLGGALALVGSAAFSGEDTLGPRIAAVYTFGAPRVGGASFGAVVKAPHHRVVNQFDLVPQVPPSWLGGYRHSGEPLLLKRNRMQPVRSRPWGSALTLGLLSLFLWPFGQRLLSLHVHDIALYATRLDVVAAERGSWS